ncbi:MAG: TetR/AcrR family transcriptional regulator [Bacillota bacterium]
MQVLKDEVKNKIHQAALAEFKEKGFLNASMRSIAERGGMTVGNLYRYFKNKEDLFHAVIQPAFQKIIDLIHFNKGQSFDGDIHVENFIESLNRGIVEIYKNHRTELLILINGCSGTNYEKGKDEIVSLVEHRIKSVFFKRLEKKGIVIEDTFLARVIAISHIEGIIAILNHYDSEEKMEKMINQYFAFQIKDMLMRFS